MGFVSIAEAPDPSIFEGKCTISEEEALYAEISAIKDEDFVLDPKIARKVVKEAEKSLEGRLPPRDKSKIKVPSLSPQELDVGSIMALGGFGLIKSVKPKKPLGTDKKLVLKTIKPQQKWETLISGANHLMREKYFLSQLDHENIIALRAYSSGGSLRAIDDTKRLDSCFLILDYLPETLSDRIVIWRKDNKPDASSTGVKNFFFKTEKMSTNNKLLAVQLQIAMDIAAALTYLHEHRIIYRDLKPQNIGFDESGVLKLFDFGLATQLAKDSDLDSTHDHLSGKVGTTRYMAPEVLRKEPYNVNVKADVFSFSLLLWELLALEKPHEKMPGAAVYGDRPKLPKSWPEALKRIIERGWSESLKDRPHIMEFKFVLRDLKRQADSSS